jgi:hypothetical protein
MSDSLTAAIAAGAALAGSGLTGMLTLHLARRGELTAALAAYGYATDRLGLEIGQLPPTPGRAASALVAATARAPHFDWSVGQLSRHTLGRPAMRALDTYNAALNRLILVAPKSVLEPAIALNELLNSVTERDDQWSKEWSAAREALARASRLALCSLAVRVHSRMRLAFQRAQRRLRR